MSHESIKTPDVSHHPCPNCDGNLVFDPKTQGLKCPYCETEVELTSAETVVEYSFREFKKDLPAWTEETHAFRCQVCGAEIMTDVVVSATSCPYCGSSHVMDLSLPDALRPEGVVPFKLDQAAARTSFESWVKRQWLAPNNFKHLCRSNPISGIYLPYWTFDAYASGSYRGEGGQYYTETRRVNGKTETVDRVRWYPTSGSLTHSFDDVCVCASKQFEVSALRKLEPFNTQEAHPYDRRYLSGYSAQHAQLNPEEGWTNGRAIMLEQLKDLAKQEIECRYDTSRNVTVNASFSDVTFKHLLLPVWVSTYEYKNKQYHYLVNGETGKVSADYPVSWVKVCLIVMSILFIIWMVYTYL